MNENDKQAEPVGVEKFTALMVGENHGLIGPFGSDFKGSPEHYQRITVYTHPAQPVQPAVAQEPVAKLKQWYDENQNLCRQFEMLKPEWEGEAFAFEQAPAQKVEPDFKAAYMEWHDKTEWVQEKEDWPFPVLGMHRADAMKKYIEHLESNQSAPAVAVNEQLLEALCKMTALYDAMGCPRGPCRILADAAIAAAESSKKGDE